MIFPPKNRLRSVVSRNSFNPEDIKSESPKTLTHWRELSISCGGKKLSIYPDGGFANGWHLADKFARARDEHHGFYSQENTTTRDNISVRLGEDIKFDVSMEDE